MSLIYKHRKELDVILGDLGILIITYIVFNYLENSKLILFIGPFLIFN